MKKKAEDVFTLEDITGKKVESMEENQAISILADNSDVSTEERFIKNPLPVPKRREHTGMDYALKIDDNDDFDIIDMTGIDFYDVD